MTTMTHSYLPGGGGWIPSGGGWISSGGGYKAQKRLKCSVLARFSMNEQIISVFWKGILSRESDGLSVALSTMHGGREGVVMFLCVVACAKFVPRKDWIVATSEASVREHAVQLRSHAVGFLKLLPRLHVSLTHFDQRRL